MLERHSSLATSTSNGGFTLVELLAAMLVGTTILGAFTGFYLAEQRALRRHQLEIAASQSLRTALEQMSRDLRSAGLDPSTNAGAGIVLATSDEVDFTRDADANGTIDSSDPVETLRFRRNGTSLESYVADGATPWVPLADNVASNGAIFRYYRCDGSEIGTLPASATDLDAIARIDVTLSVNGIGGVTFTRRESESVRLRNKVCS